MTANQEAWATFLTIGWVGFMLAIVLYQIFFDKK